MIQKVTERGPAIPEAFLRAFPAVSVTGPRLELLGDPATEQAVMRCVWDVANRGDGEGIAGLRVNLQIDGTLGDQSQLIIATDGSTSGDLVGVTYVRPLTNTPLAIAAGETGRIIVEFDVPVLNMLDRQGSVWGFNWWVMGITVWDVERDALAVMDPDLSEARYEVRDWFKIVTAPPAADLVAAADATTVVYLEALPEAP